MISGMGHTPLVMHVLRGRNYFHVFSAAVLFLLLISKVFLLKADLFSVMSHICHLFLKFYDLLFLSHLHL